MKDIATAAIVDDNAYLVEDVEIAARCAAPTLITASVTVEVERLARRIHAASTRAGSPFVPIPAAALPIETEKLAATCASLLETASGGTVLLAGVEDMPLIVQDQLMETLAELQSRRAPIAAVRIIAGTTAALRDRVAFGTFSEQLFYRLNIINLDCRKPPVEMAAQQRAPSALRRSDTMTSHGDRRNRMSAAV